MRTVRMLAVLGIVALVAGCEGRGPKETGGAVLGGVAGGLLGSQIGHGTGQLIATAGGAVLGAWIGSEIGRSMDETDRLKATQSANAALESNRDGQAGAWQNPNTGNSGYTTPTRTYQAADNTYCREYQTTVVVGGKTESAYGTACRQPDGSWKVVN
ncbi:MAG: RT0821/Lpp0805 family surface protein [Dongiaceae bacterium]